MLFNQKPSLLLVLGRDSLAFYTGKNSVEFAFTQAMVRNLEVVDGAAFAKALGQFLITNKIRNQRVLLLLDDGVVFQKTLPQANNIDAARTDFEAILPFEEADRQVTTLHLKDHVVFFATNRKLHSTVAEALKTTSSRVEDIAPLIVFLPKGGKITPTVAEGLLHDAKRAAMASFTQQPVKK